jgi:hypothetical protein
VANPYKRVSVIPSDQLKFSRLAPFIPKCPTSSNFPRWAIKSTSQDIFNNTMFIPEINIDSDQAIAVNTNKLLGKFYKLLLFN